MNRLGIIAVAIFITLVVCYFLFSSEANVSASLKKSESRVSKTIEKLKLSHDISVCGLGGSGDLDGSSLIAILLNRRGAALTREDARKIIIDFTDEFLYDINHNEALRPSLKVYPFTPANLDVEVFNRTVEGLPIVDPYIQSMGMSEGLITYNTKGLGQVYGYHSTFEETYDEAKAILAREKELEVELKREIEAIQSLENEKSDT